MFTHDALIDEISGLRKFALKLTGNAPDADDLLQSTVLRALEKKHLFNEGTNLFRWLSKIMYNIFVSAYRRRVKFETQYDPAVYIDNQSIEAPQQIEVEFQEVEQAMNSLSKEHSKILSLICIDGMKYEEVSERLSIPVGTVRSRLFRARESLRSAMDMPYYLPAYQQQQAAA